MLCVVYEHEFTKFSLADFLKERAFPERAFKIPPDILKYLQTLPSNSAAVYGLFDILSYIYASVSVVAREQQAQSSL